MNSHPVASFVWRDSLVAVCADGSMWQWKPDRYGNGYVWIRLPIVLEQ